MQRRHHEFVSSGLGLQNAEVADQKNRAIGGNANLAPLPACRTVPKRRQEIELPHERARMMTHDDEDAAATGGDLRSAPGARQPHLRLMIAADHGAVQISVAIHLRAAEKPDGDASPLQPIAEHFRHRDRGQGRLAEFAISDRERKHGRLGGDGSRFVDQSYAGGMGEAGNVTRGRGQTDADETNVIGAQGARGGDGHHLGRGVSHAGSPGRLNTFRSIQDWNRSRSRLISSQST